MRRKIDGAGTNIVARFYDLFIRERRVETDDDDIRIVFDEADPSFAKTFDKRFRSDEVYALSRICGVQIFDRYVSARHNLLPRNNAVHARELFDVHVGAFRRVIRKK